MLKHFCDKCGKEMPEDLHENLKVKAWCHQKGYTEFEQPAEGYDTCKLFTFDVCNDCAHYVIEYISGESWREIV